MKKGEHIYSILRKLKIPKSQFAKYLKKIKQLNPNIKDLNKLYAGQIIKLPKNLTVRGGKEYLNGFVIHPSLRKLTLKELKDKYPFYEEKYVVKKGDTLVKLLKIIGKIPEYLIYNEYLLIFKKLNPHIKDLNNLPQGVEVLIPTRSEPQIKQVAKQRKIKNFNIITLCLLKKLGFRIYNRGIIVLPTKKGWIQIDTDKSPLLEDLDGQKIILVDAPNIYKKYMEINEPNLSVCFLKNLSIYESLLKIFNYTKNFKIWPKGQNLIVTQDSFVAELKGDIQILKYFNQSKEKKVFYYIFFLNKRKYSYIEKLAYSFLLKNKIIVYFWSNREIDFISFPDIFRNIYVPKISLKNNIHSKLMNSLENVKINISKTLTLFVPIIKLKRENNRGIYLTEYNIPELVAILRAKGYDCYSYY